MKSKRLVVIGLCCIILASGLCIYNRLLEYSSEDIPFKEQNIYSQEVREPILYIDSSQNEIGVDSYLDAPQVLDEVKEYKNVVEIEDLDILVNINQGVSAEALRTGVGHHNSSSDIGKAGNCIIAGHSSESFDCVFNNLKNINVLDSFNLYNSKGKKFTYYVVDKYVVEPDDTSIFSFESDTIKRATLYTCTSRGTKRLIIVGEMLDSQGLRELKDKCNESKRSKLSLIHNNMPIEAIEEELTYRFNERED